MRLTPTYKKAYTLLIINSFLWGIAPAVIKTGINLIHPFIYLFYRYVIVSIPVLIYIIWKGNLRKSFKILKNPKYLLTMLCTTPLPLICIFIGMMYTTSIVAAVASAFSPVIAAILGARLMKEKVTKNEKIGTIIAFIGIILMSLTHQESNPIPLYQQIIGVLLIMTNSFIWVLGGIFYKKADPKDRDLLNLNSYFISVPLFLILSLLFRLSLSTSDIPTVAWNSIIYMAVPGTLIAFTAYQKAIELIEVSEANMFAYINPLFAIPAGIIIAGEQLELSMIFPLILIAIGIIVAVKEKFHIKKHF